MFEHNVVKAIIVDDEASGRNGLNKLIELCCPNVKVTALCSSAQEAYLTIIENQPDLLFLDIEMPQESGFDLLKRFKAIDFHVIFVTAFDRYAIQAIKLNALDYLLKPVQQDELQASVSRANVMIKKKSNELLSNFIKNYRNKVEKLAIPVRDGYSFVDLKEIVRCEADTNYSLIYLASGTKIISSKTLGEYDDTLSDFDFMRVHKSHLINLNYVKNYLKGDGGFIIMSDGVEVPVSRRKRDEFLTRINLPR